MLHYKSNHPNHVHQLTVSISKHYYVTKLGRLKYQHKPMEIHLQNATTSERIHVIHYLIRDHCTGLFFSEIAASNHLVPVEEFLHRAWGRKSDYVFCGIPQLLTLPRSVETVFPTVRESVMALGVKLVEVTSGFQGGVRDIRTIEEWLKGACEEPFESAFSEVPKIVQVMSQRKSRNGIDDKVALWLNHVPPVRLPPEQWWHKI